MKNFFIYAHSFTAIMHNVLLKNIASYFRTNNSSHIVLSWRYQENRNNTDKVFIQLEET